jgi:hypothetical protein
MELLRELVGLTVVVFSGESNKDKGVLEAYDPHWIKLRSENDTLYLQRTQVRLVKAVDARF